MPHISEATRDLLAKRSDLTDSWVSGALLEFWAQKTPSVDVTSKYTAALIIALNRRVRSDKGA